ncbi:hypothetical protein [Acinetobacter ursingii]|uniref:hypothetical protein n=1 Tax=Acinetobacter ursingii TaxID=108980 RepID=UPI0021CD3C88|nr:hypothetical protein [Acinetobacter ursingii]MCU4601867.1 hypothetical protein [Acinetobacter ursingii]
MEKIEKIRQIVTQVRQAMDELKSAGEISPNNIWFGKFPNGSCGDMSIILATHLKNSGFDLPEYICGLHIDDRRSHAWLRLDDICIDITADQFDFAQYPKVIVEFEEDYPLKTIFKPDRTPSKYEIDMDHLQSMYNKILEQLSQS